MYFAQEYVQNLLKTLLTILLIGQNFFVSACVASIDAVFVACVVYVDEGAVRFSVGVAVDKIVNGGGELIWNVLGIMFPKENGRNTGALLFSTLLLCWTNCSYQGYVSRSQCRDNPFGYISVFI